MASTLSPKLLTHLLVITILAVFAPLGQAQNLTSCSINGYLNIQDPQVPLPTNGSSPIFKTLNITETPEQDSAVLATLHSVLSPLDDTWESKAAGIWGVLTPQIPCPPLETLPTFGFEGTMNFSNWSGMFRESSTPLSNVTVAGIARVSRVSGNESVGPLCEEPAEPGLGLYWTSEWVFGWA